jgi:hypothetical protein
MTFTEAEQRFMARQTRGHLAPEIIRIYPRRVISFNVDSEHPGFAARDIKPA